MIIFVETHCNYVDNNYNRHSIRARFNEPRAGHDLWKRSPASKLSQGRREVHG